MTTAMRPSVLIFSGADPGGGAGMQADIQAVAAQGAHPLSVITALTVQDNDRVYAVQPVAAEFVRRQAQALIDKIGVAGSTHGGSDGRDDRGGGIAAIKIGIAGNRANAEAIADLIRMLRARHPDLPVVLDPVLASGHGDALATENALQPVDVLLEVATLVTPNLPEAAKLCGGIASPEAQAQSLLRRCPHVLLKGGHGTGDEVINRWFTRDARQTRRDWRTPRLAGEFHGTGCTLASAIAALLATGHPMEESIARALSYCHRTLLASYAIADGQRIPDRRAGNPQTEQKKETS